MCRSPTCERGGRRPRRLAPGRWRSGGGVGARGAASSACPAGRGPLRLPPSPELSCRDRRASVGERPRPLPRRPVPPGSGPLALKRAVGGSSRAAGGAAAREQPLAAGGKGTGGPGAPPRGEPAAAARRGVLGHGAAHRRSGAVVISAVQGVGAKDR